MNAWRARLDLHCQQDPRHNVFVDELCQYSYGDLRRAAEEWKSQVPWLCPGDRVVVLLPRNAKAALLLAVLLVNGFVGVFVDPRTPTVEIGRTLKSLHPKALVSVYELPRTLVHASMDLPIPFCGPQHRWKISKPVESQMTALHPEGLAWLLYTSGTSGAPKAVMLSEENLYARTRSEISDFQLGREDIIFNCLPFSHDLGLNQVLCSVWLGATLFIKSRSVSSLIEALRDSKAIGVTATPLVWLDLMKVQTNSVDTSLRYLTVSGGSLAPGHLQKLKEIFPTARVIRTYGQTETFRTFINDSTEEGLGRLVADTQVKFSAEGELIHFGPTAMTGYLFDDELTKSKRTLSGGILTGDLVFQDSRNKYHFRGRKDDLVKRFEQRFFLSDVEAFFRTIPGVFEAIAVVVAAPVSDWRQLYLGVFLQETEGRTLDFAAVQELARQNLSYFKLPDVISFVLEIPKTSSQKVDRHRLQDLLLQELL
jgi:acyl-CoA synthetase (AMP-forming)/AMP-acid ligase II